MDICSIVGANSFIKKGRKEKGKGKERALVYWLTLLYLFVSLAFMLLHQLSLEKN
jgi:hypothetical protein